jgi:hypothetical protein
MLGCPQGRGGEQAEGNLPRPHMHTSASGAAHHGVGVGGERVEHAQVGEAGLRVGQQRGRRLGQRLARRLAPLLPRLEVLPPAAWRVT